MVVTHFLLYLTRKRCSSDTYKLLEQVILGPEVLNQVKSRSLTQVVQVIAEKLKTWLPGHHDNKKFRAGWWEKSRAGCFAKPRLN